MSELLERIETAAALLGIEPRDARRHLLYARRSLPNATDDDLVSVTIDLMRRDHSASAINQARRSIGLIE